MASHEDFVGKHERIDEKVPIPEGTNLFIRADEDHKPDTYGVQEIRRTSRDGTVLVHYGQGTNTSNDILVRMKGEELTGELLNEIGTLVRVFLENRAQHESVPSIKKPVDELKEELRKILSISIVSDNYYSPSANIEEAMQQLGIVTNKLVEGEPRTLREMTSSLKTLHQLGVLRITPGLHNSAVETEPSFHHYRKKLEALEQGADAA